MKKKIGVILLLMFVTLFGCDKTGSYSGPDFKDKIEIMKKETLGPFNILEYSQLMSQESNGAFIGKMTGGLLSGPSGIIAGSWNSGTSLIGFSSYERLDNSIAIVKLDMTQIRLVIDDSEPATIEFTTESKVPWRAKDCMELISVSRCTTIKCQDNCISWMDSYYRHVAKSKNMTIVTVPTMEHLNKYVQLVQDIDYRNK